MKPALTTINRRELIQACGALGAASTLTHPLLALAQDATAADPLIALRESLRGTVILPGDMAYDDARKVWNGMIDRHPAAVAQCSGVADVIEAVNFARKHKIPVSVRGGGHNVAGKAVRDDAIVIDLASIHGIRVDPESKTARAGGGARWNAFDYETNAHGLVTTGGTVSTTGVGGLTLGGGLGWLMRKHGLACDNLIGADVVTADGRFLKASATENSDLLWALRGGGGNFGVVTSLDFRLHDAEPIVGGMALYPGAMLADVLRFFRSYTESLADSVTTMAGVVVSDASKSGPDRNAAWIAVCHSGPVDEGLRLVRPIKDFGPPMADQIGETPYLTLQTMFDAGSAPGQRNYWRSNFLEDLGDEAIDTFVSLADAGIAGSGTNMFFEHMGGAIARVGEHDTAFSNRKAKYDVTILGSWPDAADDAANIAWTRASGDKLKAFATGAGYVNYMTGDEGSARVRSTYEANLERLIEVKRKYDPTNFFSSNQNIAP
jgi:FAD/FMN-containing dehydrogenase